MGVFLILIGSFLVVWSIFVIVDTFWVKRRR